MPPLNSAVRSVGGDLELSQQSRSEAVAVVGWAGIVETLESSPHPLWIAKAAFLRDRFDWKGGLLELAASCLGPHPFSEPRGSFSRFVLEKTREITDAHSHTIRQRRDTQILLGMSQHPGL